ncbi:MAG: pilus assembly protein PilM [Firmicutes bacterium]|nr:pilus assembly protein PilM [Bacillota bacterium]
MELRWSKPKVALAIEADQREVRGLELRAARGVVRITRCARRALPEALPYEEKVVAALKALAQELPPEGKEIYVALPRGLAVERLLELPPLKDELLGAALVHEVERIVPWPLDAVHFGYQVLKRGERLEVLVAVIRREVLAGYLGLFERAGLEVAGAGLTDLAMLNAYHETVGARPDESRLIVGIRDGTADLAWTQKGRVGFSRDLVLEPAPVVFEPSSLVPKPSSEGEAPGSPGEDLPEEGPMEEARLLTAELRRTTAFVNTLPGASPVKGVWLTGRVADFGGATTSPNRNRSQFIGFLTRELGVPVRVWPGETFGVFSEVGNQVFAPAFMVCYGLALQALGRGTYLLNLNPSAGKRPGARGALGVIEAQPFWLKAAVLAGITIIFAGAGLGIDTVAKQRQVRQAREQLARLAPRVAEARVLQAEYRRIEEEYGLLEQRASGRRYLELLSELHRLMPQDGWVELLSLEGDKLQELRGKARSATQVMSLLQRSPYLRELKFSAPIMSVTENGTAYETFRISGKVVEPAGVKPVPGNR